jgi:SAM-dependent methyltransferase
MTPADTAGIDWNEVWRKSHAEKRIETRDPEYWNKRAPGFVRHARNGDYVDQFLEIMKPKPDWSVLDIGCAAGTLAVPLAAAVKRITALDASSRMIALLEKRCNEQGIGNIEMIIGRWEDDWDAAGIGVHDVAVASRSLIVEDLRAAVLKLQRYARRRVYISTLVDDGPHDRRIFEAVGRDFHHGADYIVVYSLLRQMGIYANVTFTCNREEKRFRDMEEAVNSLRWMIFEMTTAEEELLRRHLSKCLVRENGHWKLPYRRVVRWAVLWWEKACDQPEER